MTPTVRRRPTAHTSAVLDSDQAAAHGRLLAEVAEHVDAGLVIPCADPDADDWISDRREAQEVAAARCQDCPALLICAAYAVTWPEPAGVYGGTTPAQRCDELDLDALLAQPA